jgi:hypothetical protein
VIVVFLFVLMISYWSVRMLSSIPSIVMSSGRIGRLLQDVEMLMSLIVGIRYALYETGY